MNNENKRILILAILSIQSSYLQETEAPAGEVPDTVQFWLLPQSAWRIKTFATDHDIHIHEVPGLSRPAEECVDFLVQNIEKSYGDVIAAMHVLRFDDCTDTAAMNAVLTANGLKPQLEIAPAGFAFYNPDNARYRTLSEPK